MTSEYPIGPSGCPEWQSDDGSVRLILGDCIQVLPTLSGIDCVVTDPPWELAKGQIEIRGTGVAPARQASKTLSRGAVGQFDVKVIELLQDICDGDCLFFAGYRELADLIKACRHYRGTFAWHKPNGAPAAFYPAKMDLSFIVWSAKKSVLYGYQHWPSMVFSFPFPQAGCMAVERYVDSTFKAIHPCQGPLRLYEALIHPMLDGCTVLDCYFGTGTTGVACIRTGRRFIGIEIEPKYFDIAVQRCKAELERFPLFEPKPPRQLELIP